MKMVLIAGEPSGDALGAALMTGLKSLRQGIRFQGVGGPLMQAEGLTSQFPMQELSVMGLLEVLPKYRHLKRRIAETAQAVINAAPDVLITIDSPDFCLRVAALVRAARPGQRTIHYVAPTVWAWRPGRAAKMAPFIDHVLTLFPFEPPYMERAGMGATFVGHPVVAQPLASADQAADFRARHAIDGDAPLILCLPGSRRGEVARLLPRFGQTLDLLRPRHPGLRIVLPTVAPVADLVRDLTRTWPDPPLILQDAPDKSAAFAAADLALAASGTVSLELAANRLPMVIAYDFNWLTYRLMRRAALIDTFTLVNIVTGSRTVPEFIGPDCRPGPVADMLHRYLTEPALVAAQRAAHDQTMDLLGRGGEAPGLRAARAVLAEIG